MISCAQIIPCETSLLDAATQYLTTVHVYDVWRAPGAFPVALPRIAAGIILERAPFDAPVFDGEIRIRVGDDVVATISFRIDFEDKLFKRLALGPTTGLVAKETTTISLEVWHAGPGGNMIDNVRFPILPAQAPAKETLQ